jgi:penicillin amidase
MIIRMRLARAALAAIAMLAATPAAAAAVSSAVRQQQLSVAGLEQPAQIVVDQWGIPHIYAASVHDAFFLQGYNAARDRLWQIDLWRKRGLGLLSRSFGATYVPEDRATRLLLYRGDMDKEWAAYGPQAKGYAEAFVAGVNAFVGEVRAGKRPLPIEFKLAGSAPDLWKPEDVVRIRSHALTRNLDSEVARAQVACAAGLGADALRRKLEPAWTTRVPAGLDPCDITPDVLKDYRLGTGDVTFSNPNVKTASETPEQVLADAALEAASEGSNNWVVSPSRTATGRPILANDPHRELGAPSLRYIVGLNAPGLAFIGAGEPALPGVTLGHNDRIAFGITIFPTDQEDLYVYDLNPADPRQYRYDGRWEQMTVVHEQVEVKGAPAQDVELDYTRHGPVLYIDPVKHRAFALRTVWTEPGTAAYFGSAAYLTASDWSGFKAALDHWGAASLNFVYADTGGNIGWVAEGKAPVRPNWDGLLPVPGDGRYEWSGFLSEDQLPSSFNPAKGWFATANALNLPDGYPYAERKVSFEWSDPTRLNRISSVLGANSKVTLADSMALQADDYSNTDMRAVALLFKAVPGLVDAAPAPTDSSDLAWALDQLKSWNGHLDRQSAAAAIVEVWVNKYLGPTAVKAVTPQAARSIVGAGSPDAVISWLEAHPDSAVQGGVGDAILIPSLKAALAELRQRLGPDMSAWTWGKLHHATFVPAVGPLADPATLAQMSVGPLEAAGAATSPMAQTYRMGDFAVIAGASVRMDLDVGDWDNSMVINTPGQSGDPFSPHYRDLFPLWNAGEFVPLLYSREAVDRAARLVINLSPGG